MQKMIQVNVYFYSYQQMVSSTSRVDPIMTLIPAHVGFIKEVNVHNILPCDIATLIELKSDVKPNTPTHSL